MPATSLPTGIKSVEIPTSFSNCRQKGSSTSNFFVLFCFVYIGSVFPSDLSYNTLTSSGLRPHALTLTLTEWLSRTSERLWIHNQKQRQLDYPPKKRHLALHLDAYAITFIPQINYLFTGLSNATKISLRPQLQIKISRQHHLQRQNTNRGSPFPG